MIQGESSATLILGSFRLNCCKGQFFHDKQIASVPQQHWGGSLPPPPSLHGALSHPPPQGSARGRCSWAGMVLAGWARRGAPGASHATGEFSPGAAGTSLGSKLPEIKNLRKALPSHILTSGCAEPWGSLGFSFLKQDSSPGGSNTWNRHC